MQKNWPKIEKNTPEPHRNRKDEPFDYQRGFWLLFWALLIQTTAFFIN